MAKKILTLIKLQIPGGQANPAPPVGPALGQHGVNIMEFCKAFNAQTQQDAGTIIPVEITDQMAEGAIRPKPKVLFEAGESVKVIDGPFQDFNGVVEEVKPEKGKLRVLISIFGRATPVELDFVQVEKA